MIKLNNVAYPVGTKILRPDFSDFNNLAIREVEITGLSFPIRYIWREER